MNPARQPELVVSDNWRKTHPGAAVGALAVSGAAAPQTWPELDSARTALEADLRRRFKDRDSIRDLPLIKAYTAYYKRFKKTYHVALQVESVAVKGKGIPAVAPLVQAMFMAEMKNLLLTAGHDRRALQGPVRLETAEGREAYQGMGNRPLTLKAGDMFIADDLGIISSVIYGPDERSKITRATTEALYCVYAVPGVEPEAVESHLRDIAGYIRLFAPGAAVDLLRVHPAH